MNKILLHNKEINKIGTFFVHLSNGFKIYLKDAMENLKPESLKISEGLLLNTQTILKRTKILKEKILQEIVKDNELLKN